MRDKTYYYEVWVASPKFHKDSYLTYSCESKLEAGNAVVVPVNRAKVPALIVNDVKKPSFKTKPIDRLISENPMPKELIDLAAWIKDYYPAPTGQIMSLFLHSSLVTKSRTKQPEPSSIKLKQNELPKLTDEQQSVISSLIKSSSSASILHGDTGSGKTRVYLELVKHCINSGKSSIILTPEIGLTPQLARDCLKILPNQTVIVHSRLTPAQKRESWLRILDSDQPLVVIGARSALFSPLKNIGAIIVDEFHESSYKQEQAPHYLTSRVGAKLANLHNAQLILGSATPLIADYYAFEQKNLPIMRMDRQAAQDKKSILKNKNPRENVTVIDSKQKNYFSRSKWICDELISEINNAVQRKEQSLIFLNRRGTARLIMCNSCAWQELCPNCDLPLTYHGDSHRVICHTCGFVKSARPSCPSCGSSDIIFRAIGTKALEAELAKLFPGAKTKRFDSDLTKAERLENNYKSLKDGGYDIIVGTQMIGKGLDLPKLSVLGVISADTSLSFPDYTSSERTYQLITQALGRINRGHVAGKAYIQTYHPGNKVINYALDKDYRNFYEGEIEERKTFNFPPFCYILKISCSYTGRNNAEKSAEKLAEQLKKSINKVEILGPSPKFIEKVSGRYRWQLIIKSKDRNRLVNIARQLPAKWSYDIDPINLL